MNARRAVLAGLALIAGVLAGVVGNHKAALSGDQISAVNLAQRIVNHQPGMQLLDLRTRAEFDQDRLPGAVLLSALNDSLPAEVSTWVVYANHSVEPEEFRPLIQRLGGREVLRLHGGLQAWSDEVMFPHIRSDATAVARREFETIARLSRYFGGSPRVLALGEVAAGQKRSRRGC